MKRFLLTSIACTLLCLSLSAQVRENESTIVYSMPYTWVDVQVRYTITHTQPGVFMRYAERYLGTKDVVTTEETTYQIQDVRLRTHTTADAERTYTILLTGKGVQIPCLQLNKQGILVGINTVEQPVSKVANKKSEKKQPAAQTVTPALMPLLEEQMMANSVAKMAEGAARQIYRIRETRLNILAGDVDNAPADGDAMRQVLAELNKQEAALTALFIGTTHTTEQKEVLTLDPATAKSGILFRFSKYAGVVAADDLSGEPYEVVLQRHAQTYAAAEETENTKKNASTPAIYYNLPGEVHITLKHHDEVWADQTLPVAQLGISIPLPINALRDAQVTLHPQTGALVSISK